MCYYSHILFRTQAGSHSPPCSQYQLPRDDGTFHRQRARFTACQRVHPNVLLPTGNRRTDKNIPFEINSSLSSVSEAIPAFCLKTLFITLL